MQPSSTRTSSYKHSEQSPEDVVMLSRRSLLLPLPILTDPIQSSAALLDYLRNLINNSMLPTEITSPINCPLANSNSFSLSRLGSTEPSMPERTVKFLSVSNLVTNCSTFSGAQTLLSSIHSDLFLALRFRDCFNFCEFPPTWSTCYTGFLEFQGRGLRSTAMPET